MKPFDLEAALKGAKVVTRDGREVKQLTRFEVGSGNSYPLTGVIDGWMQTWTLSGAFESAGPGSNDLFMAESEPKPTKKVTYWTNFYPGGESHGHPTRADADRRAADDRIGKARKVVLEVADE